MASDDTFSRMEAAVEAGRTLGKRALYFGCFNNVGHFLHYEGGRLVRHGDFPDLPWNNALMDTGLLRNGKHADVIDGNVFWTCGGAKAFWYAFYWWDRSIDSRHNSNSGFYVRGFGWPKAHDAFAYACEKFPHVTARQKVRLELQMSGPDDGK